MSTSRKVLLCTGTSSENQYEDILTKNGHICEILPVLDFEFVNLDDLKSHLLKPESYSGLILTSPRSVTAIKLVSLSLEPWKQLSTFCIGQATESAAKSQIGLTKILGTESGNSKNLAHFILNRIEKSSKPLLLPCSDIARDTLSQILSDGGLQVQRVVVYKTKSNEHLKDLLNECMLKKPDVIVFFSPSTLNYVLSGLENDKSVFETLQIVAIGPVTEQALINIGIEVNATLDKPDAKSLLEAVNNLEIK